MKDEGQITPKIKQSTSTLILSYSGWEKREVCHQPIDKIKHRITTHQRWPGTLTACLSFSIVRVVSSRALLPCEGKIGLNGQRTQPLRQEKDPIAHSPGVAPLYYFSYLLFIGPAPFGPKQPYALLHIPLWREGPRILYFLLSGSRNGVAHARPERSSYLEASYRLAQSQIGHPMIYSAVLQLTSGNRKKIQ